MISTPNRYHSNDEIENNMMGWAHGTYIYQSDTLISDDKSAAFPPRSSAILKPSEGNEKSDLEPHSIWLQQSHYLHARRPNGHRRYGRS